jgi:hypothetical protein
MKCVSALKNAVFFALDLVEWTLSDSGKMLYIA